MHREVKISVLAEFITKTNAQEMRWLIMIILKGETKRVEISLIHASSCVHCPRIVVRFIHRWAFYQKLPYANYNNMINFIPDLKLGISEKTVFNEFHPDAEDYFNVTCDLKLVCEKLRDRSIRYKRQVKL